ncbi:MAG: hypothetical protein JRI39_03935 [Deltaproteobacteria bacterium]|nr:hypothetical protein [Deltaproteobacteria bacterium]MBW2082244.1 hypothetical protein [Deltaproteobacteria bacterium]HDM09992.1 hypothetical protein [Desulfobacteraceae bacterium]
MKKKMLSTQVRNDLLKEFKKLAIDLERPINDVLEEAMLDLLDKYGVEFHPAGTEGQSPEHAIPRNGQKGKRKAALR